MRENRDEITIHASPEKVWNVLTDLARHADWNPQIYLGKGIIEVGKTVQLSCKTGSIDLVYRCLVRKAEPNRELRWTWHILFPFLMTGDHLFKLDPVGENTVLFTNVEIFTGVLVPFMAKFLRTEGKDSMVAMDRALKDRAEQL